MNSKILHYVEGLMPNCSWGCSWQQQQPLGWGDSVLVCSTLPALCNCSIKSATDIHEVMSVRHSQMIWHCVDSFYGDSTKQATWKLSVREQLHFVAMADRVFKKMFFCTLRLTNLILDKLYRTSGPMDVFIACVHSLMCSLVYFVFWACV